MPDTELISRNCSKYIRNGIGAVPYDGAWKNNQGKESDDQPVIDFEIADGPDHPIQNLPGCRPEPALRMFYRETPPEVSES